MMANRRGASIWALQGTKGHSHDVDNTRHHSASHRTIGREIRGLSGSGASRGTSRAARDLDCFVVPPRRRHASQVRSRCRPVVVSMGDVDDVATGKHGVPDLEHPPAAWKRSPFARAPPAPARRPSSPTSGPQTPARARRPGRKSPTLATMRESRETRPLGPATGSPPAKNSSATCDSPGTSSTREAGDRHSIAPAPHRRPSVPSSPTSRLPYVSLPFPPHPAPPRKPRARRLPRARRPSIRRDARNRTNHPSVPFGATLTPPPRNVPAPGR